MAKYDKLLAKMVTPFGYREMKALEPRVTATEATAAALGSQLNGVVASLPEAPAWEELDRIKQVLAFSLIPGHRNVGGIDAGLWMEGLATDWPPDWILGGWLHDDTLSFSPWTPNPAWVPFPAPGVATTGTLAVTLTGSSAGRWSVNNGSTWYTSGVLVTLPEGAYEVSYKPVSGRISPPRYPVTITPGGAVAFTAGYTTLDTTGYLSVTLSGSTEGRWSVDGGATWRDGGATLALAAGSYTVTFLPVSGYTAPTSFALSVPVGKTVSRSAAYMVLGTLTVTLSGTEDGRWSIDSGATWLVSGASLTLPIGTYPVSFLEVDGYVTPDGVSATVPANDTLTVSASYEAATSDGLLFATGSNFAGQLGLGDSGEGTNRSAFSLVGDRVWSAIAAGYTFSIGISNGELYAWGMNDYGQLGLGDTDSRSVPTKVGSATNWVSIAAGKYYALAVNDVGELYAWGANGSSYRLGLGDTDQRNVPTRVGSATNWLAVAAGDDHSIAVNTAGEIYAWGSNQSGKTGLGVSEGNTTTPTKIGSATNWLAVAAGAYASFAVNTAGELYSWGHNTSGVLLGIGSDEGVEVTTPTRVGSATNWATVATGLGTHAFATTLGGALYAWGMNDYGQLGLGDTTNRNAPVQVGSAENWASISTGDNHSVVVNNAGELFTCGRYTSGRLGQGSEHINIPTRVGTGTGWLQVAAGKGHTLATMALTGDNGLLSASGVMDSYGEVSPYASATWSVDGGTTWNAGGSAIQLPAGAYTITWGGADEYTNAPASSSVTITAGQATVVQGTYTPNW